MTTNGTPDSCPAWAGEAIEQLKQIEVYLGNIPSNARWQTQHVSEIFKRTFNKNEQVFDEDKAEFVFKKIVRGLKHEGFTVDKIVEIVNGRIAYVGGPRYCNAAEVSEALSQD